MPCYDKKLEASRKDFYDDVYSTRDVDCVITTGELELMMREKGWDISLPVPGELDPFPSPTPPFPYTSPNKHTPNPATSAPLLPMPIPELLTHPGTSSGSYLHAIIAHLQATSLVPLVLSTKTVRNADYEEYILRKRVDARTSEINGVHLGGNGINAIHHTNGINGINYPPPQEQELLGQIVFKGAKCYGFRNLQNVVRKVGRERGVRTASGAAGKLGGSARPRANGAGGGVRRLRRGGGGITEKEQEEERGYDYVEVMACPGGCVNGGGQLKPVLNGNGTGTSVDEEGYKRDWDGSGVVVGGDGGGGEVNVLQNAKWGDREWTKRVEEVYWRDRDGGLGMSDYFNVDVLMERVWDDLVRGMGDEGMEVDGVVEEEQEREKRRRGFFRTQYRAVESEVVGLAVVW
jgi:Iron only hydrogenase large subunit, C-terminal domain